jgi:hypothetical protein
MNAQATAGGRFGRQANAALSLVSRCSAFDDVLQQVRKWLGSEVAVVIWLNEFGRANGWLIDIDGPPELIDDPVMGIDQPVHYVRFASGNGFSLERTWFRSAKWNSVAGERSLDVNLGAVTVSITPASR